MGLCSSARPALDAIPGAQWLSRSCQKNLLSAENEAETQVFAEFEQAHPELHEWLREAGQEHIMAQWQQLGVKDREGLSQDLNDLDIAELEGIRSFMYDSLDFEAVKEENRILESECKGPKLMRWPTEAHSQGSQGQVFVKQGAEEVLRKRFTNTAEILVSDGHVAVCILPGRGGSLALIEPSALQSKKSILQLILERLQRLQILVRRNRERANISVLILADEHSEDKVRRHLRAANYFGIDGNSVRVVREKGVPCFGFDGRLLLDENESRLLKSPGGDGDALLSLERSGALAELHKSGCQLIEFIPGDNLLARPADLFYLGFAKECNADITVKCIQRLREVPIAPLFIRRVFGLLHNELAWKVENLQNGVLQPGPLPSQSVGIIDKKVLKSSGSLRDDDVSCIIRPQEHSQEFLRQRASKNCGYYFSASVTGTYLFSLSFVEWLLSKAVVDEMANAKLFRPRRVIEPKLDEPDVLEFERCLSDSIIAAKRCVALAAGSDEFGPIDEFDGLSKHGGIPALSRLHQKWILDIGASFRDGLYAGDDPDKLCEISPLVSYAGEGLEGFFPEGAHDGILELDLPLYVPSASSPLPQERHLIWADREAEFEDAGDEEAARETEREAEREAERNAAEGIQQTEKQLFQDAAKDPAPSTDATNTTDANDPMPSTDAKNTTGANEEQNNDRVEAGSEEKTKPGDSVVEEAEREAETEAEADMANAPRGAGTGLNVIGESEIDTETVEPIRQTEKQLLQEEELLQADRDAGVSGKAPSPAERSSYASQQGEL